MENSLYPVRLQLLNAPAQLTRDLGYGKSYQYTHDFEGRTADMEYLPEALHRQRYYEPTDIGNEAVIREYLERVQKR